FVAEPRADVAYESWQPSGPRDRPGERRDDRRRERRDPRGEGRRQPVLTRGGIEVGVDVDERVAGNELRGVVPSRADGSAGELARQRGHRDEEERGEEAGEQGEHDDPSPDVDVESAPRARGGAARSADAMTRPATRLARPRAEPPRAAGDRAAADRAADPAAPTASRPPERPAPTSRGPRGWLCA